MPPSPGEDAVTLARAGLAAHQQGRHHEAIELMTRALALDATIPALHANLADALNAAGRFDQALAACDAALRLRPQYAIALLNRGNALLGKGAIEESIVAYTRALAVQPDLLPALNNLGHALGKARRTDDSIDFFARAIRLRADVPEFHANLGNALKDQARLDEAVACHREAIRLAPDNARFGSSLLYTLCFHPRVEPHVLFDEHRRWAARHADALRDPRTHENVRDPDRRLRIGYVSPDFRAHVLGLYAEPLLARHDRERFEVVCYSDVASPDAATARMRARADLWRETHGLSDAALAEFVRADRIDVLVDMTNHMGANRLLAFARRPAPVQVTFPHPFTTGMSAMDYVITDPHLDPPGDDGYGRAERLLRLPDTYLPYPETSDSPDIHAPPSASGAPPTFLSVNNFCKLNDGVLRAWSRILLATPDSRLLVRLDGGAANHRAVPRWFAEQGIDPARVEFIDALPRDEYLRLFARADVALDPFPYAGYTTSLDALWMGVPIITLAGHASLGRFGVSILANLGLAELIAPTADEYVALATALARDSERLSRMRAGMRERMRRSPLMDAERFARNVESAYRSAWKSWLGGSGPPS